MPPPTRDWILKNKRKAARMGWGLAGKNERGKPIRLDLKEARELGISRERRRKLKDDPAALGRLIEETRKVQEEEEERLADLQITEDYYAWVRDEFREELPLSMFAGPVYSTPEEELNDFTNHWPPGTTARENLIERMVALRPMMARDEYGQMTAESQEDLDMLLTDDEWFKRRFPAFDTLERAGHIGKADIAGYKAYELSVKMAYVNTFGGEAMSDEQFNYEVNEGAARGRDVESIASYFGYKKRVSDLYSQYSADPDASPESFGAQADQDFLAGKTSDRVEKGLQAGAWAQTFGAEAQDIAARFGGGRMTPAELQALGEQEAGLTSALGLGMQRRVAQASERMARIFQGQTIRGQLTLPEATDRDARRGSRVDIGA